MTTYQRALHIFRRDLRLDDNTALNAALESAREVIPCFIFNDTQVAPHPYRSVNGLAFMIESLEELAKEISQAGGQLLVLHGAHHEVVARLIKELSIDAVFFNMDYTPFSRKRDAQIFETCKKLNVHCAHYSDALLVEPSEFGKDDGKPYTVYTPFFKKASKLTVPHPTPRAKGTLGGSAYRGSLVAPRDFWPKDVASGRLSVGGRSQALGILETLRSFTKYEEERNLPAVRGTTLLAPHNKFGTVSIREVYHAVAKALGVTHTLIRELYWRDFFTHIAWHFPRVFGHAFHPQYDKIAWSDDNKLFSAWCEGRTGFPIVDAGMRELVSTGFMHNRVRMIVASFLVKDLHISWQQGEQFFAQHLTDYDPAVNNGSWQWAASTGCDAQPYFRIFNPWLQQKRFDPECGYIKKWVPELKQLRPAQIHTLYEDGLIRSVDYPQPIVEHSVQKIHAEEMFRECAGKKPVTS
jgi:deoxyribodipyrimidine photo-lyase